MDWNKSNTILLIAFLIVNIFLFGYIYYSDEKNVTEIIENNQEFVEEVENILKTKDITINCSIPSKVYEVPFLEIDYEIIYPSKSLIDSYLGQYDKEIIDDIFIYEKDGQTLQIVGGKKIIYSKEQSDKTEIISDDLVDNIINEFCNNKNIDLSKFSLDCIIDDEDYKIVKYVENYKEYKLDNSYAIFYLTSEGVEKFEMQRISNIKERAKVKVISAPEALLRIMTYDDINNKEIKDIKICYYTDENIDFEAINTINVDLVWKVIFSDNSYVYLTGADY